MTKFKYDVALARLQEISKLLESDVEDINELSGLVKESAKLIKQCKLQLKNTSEEIEKNLNNLD
jgi:exonuclease VII small subunit